MIWNQTYQGNRQGRKMTSSHRFIGAFLYGALFYLLAALPSSAATILPNGEQTFIDANGAPLAAGTVDFYVPGGFVRKNTWLSSTATNPNLNANPVVLDAAGRAVIYGIGCYRQIVKNSAGVQQWDKTTCDTSSGEASWGGLATGTPNAIIVTADNFTGTDGQVIRFIAASTNLGATTVNPSVAGVAFGAVTVLVDGGAGPIACTGGEIVAGNVVTLVYDSNLGAFHLSTLTTVTAGAGLSTAGVGSSGGTGATSVTLTSVQPVNAQTGTTYTVQTTDNAKLITLTNAAAITLTVPAATTTFGAGFSFNVLNKGGSLVTVTPAAGTVNGVSSIVVPGNFHSIKMVSDGTNWWAQFGYPPIVGAAAGFKNLAIVNDPVTPNTLINITADYLALSDTSGNSFAVTAVSVVCNYALNVAGGGSLDTGAFSVATWYFHFVISNGTTTSCLGSASATAPTMPTGYTYKTRVGANRTLAGAAQFNRVIQKGRKAQYILSAAATTILPVMDNGTKGTYSTTAPTWQSIAVANFVPTTASEITVIVGGGWKNSTGAVQLAPNNLYGGWANANGNMPMFDNGSSTAAVEVQPFTITMVLESANIFWASTGAGSAVLALGWGDNL